MRTATIIAMLAAAAALAACNEKAAPPLLGYVEIEPTRVSSPQAGRLVRLAVVRGGEVDAGAPLFALDTELEQPALAEAEARELQNRAQARDLDTGKRPAELEVLRARVAVAESARQLAERDLQRQQSLAERGFISDAGLDALRERVRTARAQLVQAQADVRAAELAGREAQRAAAAAAVRVADAQRAQAKTRIAQKDVVAPASARVEDTYYRVGEWVPAGTPVVSLLPQGAIKLRFFIPEERLMAVRAGGRVRVSCDGCGDSFLARVTWVATNAEYTPPVIYSKDNRAKLVFRAEAFPESTVSLPPGLPVELVPFHDAAK